MATRVQIRRDTAANWAASNPVLAQGELGVELGTNRVKLGDGSTVWSSLLYLGGPQTGTLLSKSVAGSADVALSALEAQNSIIVLTGEITGNIAVSVPAAGRWTFRNSTSGSFWLRLKAAGSSAQPLWLRAGSILSVWSDGTDLYRANVTPVLHAWISNQAVTRNSDNSTDATYQTIGSIVVPGGLMAPNDVLEIRGTVNHTGSTNTKRVRTLVAGSQVALTSQNTASNTSSPFFHALRIRDASTLFAQAGSATGYSANIGTINSVTAALANDITIDIQVSWNANVSGEYITVEGWDARLMRAA